MHVFEGRHVSTAAPDRPPCGTQRRRPPDADETVAICRLIRLSRRVETPDRRHSRLIPFALATPARIILGSVGFCTGTRFGLGTLPFHPGEGEANRATDTSLNSRASSRSVSHRSNAAPDWLACVERDVQTPPPLNSAHVMGRLP
jgi:hypothetical protein